MTGRPSREIQRKHLCLGYGSDPTASSRNQQGMNDKGKRENQPQKQKINSKSMVMAAVRELQFVHVQCHALDLPHSIE